MDSIQNILKEVLQFREERDWKQFHTPKDLAISLSLEASEVLEHFLWKKDNEVQEYIEKNREDLADELGDVFHNLLLLANDLDINLLEAIKNKLEKTSKKYPIEKARGNHKKYTEL